MRDLTLNFSSTQILSSDDYNNDVQIEINFTSFVFEVFAKRKIEILNLSTLIHQKMHRRCNDIF